MASTMSEDDLAGIAAHLKVRLQIREWLETFAHKIFHETKARDYEYVLATTYPVEDLYCFRTKAELSAFLCKAPREVQQRAAYKYRLASEKIMML